MSGTDLAVNQSLTGQASAVFSKTEMERELRQGEILTNLTQYIFVGGEAPAFMPRLHLYAISATSDCDLLQEFNRRDAGKESDLNGILFYEAKLASDLRASGMASDQWKRIRQNKDERYQVFEAVPDIQDTAGEGFGPLVIDFKRSFSIDPAGLYDQISTTKVAKRRSRLEMPYREHFICRAAFFFQRVMIPTQHEVPQSFA